MAYPSTISSWVSFLTLGCILYLGRMSEAATLTSGCNRPIPTEVTVGGRSYNFTNFLSNSTSPPSSRAYSLTVPEDYEIDTPAPLILSFHGRGENNLDQEQTSKLSSPFFNTKAIAVYPQGINVSKHFPYLLPKSMPDNPPPRNNGKVTHQPRQR